MKSQHRLFLKLARGFTVIETLMTIILVSVVAIPLALFLSRHVNSLYQSRDYTMAVNLARFDMERVKNMPYGNIVSASFPNFLGYNYGVTRTVTFMQGNAGSAESLKQVQVDVRATGSATILVSLVTYIAKNANYYKGKKKK